MLCAGACWPVGRAVLKMVNESRGSRFSFSRPQLSQRRNGAVGSVELEQALSDELRAGGDDGGVQTQPKEQWRVAEQQV